jgi:hypothetical protein
MTDQLDPYPGNLRNHQVAQERHDWLHKDNKFVKAPSTGDEVRIIRRVTQDEDEKDVEVFYPADVHTVGGEKYVYKVNLNSYTLEELSEKLANIRLAMGLPVIDEDSLDVRRK